VLAEVSVPISIVLALSLFQTTILLSVAIFFGLLLGKQVGLGAPLLTNILKKEPIEGKFRDISLLSVSLGALAGILIIAFDFIFQFFMPAISNTSVPLWQGFLGSFYGGIVEEILLRLFLVTLLVWILWRFHQKRNGAPSKTIVWIAIVFAAVVFGLSHLPATAALTTITSLVIFRAVLLNGIAGIIFGWLFWKKGLEAAIISHFVADIVLLVIFPTILLLG
jgi:membrane protease YdiL (CAAX protease family)